MPAPRYTATNASAVALSAATARSVIGAKAHANSGLLLVGYEIAFDGVSASAVPVLIETCYCTFATNGPGTNSTSITIAQEMGRVLTAGFTAAGAWTAGNEPTTITALRKHNLTPNGGVILYDYPLGTEPDANLAEGFVIRCTAPATVNVLATLILSRC
jgi:hypothetical protein